MTTATTTPAIMGIRSNPPLAGFSLVPTPVVPPPVFPLVVVGSDNVGGLRKKN